MLPLNRPAVRVAFLVGVTGTASCMGAGARAPRPPGVTAAGVLARHVDAIGGRANLDRIRSIQTVGIMNDRGTLHPMFTDRKRPDLLRVRMIHGGELVFTEVYNGSRSWEGAPGKENCSPDSAARAATRRAAEQFDDPLITAAANAETMTLAGVEEISGHRLYRLDIRQKDGSEGSYYIDTHSFLLDRVRQQRALHPGESVRTIDYVLDDYRPVSGVLVAFRSMERDVESGEPLTVSFIQWAEANVPLTGDPYGLPASCR